MPQLIKGRAIAVDRYALLREAKSLADVPAGGAIVPLALWRAERDALLRRADVGVWLAPNDDPAALANDVGGLPVIAVDFPKFSDGRGYSLGRLLRDRYGFEGELRAIGDVLRDQLFALSECGFDAFALRADRDIAGALASFDDFASVYAATSRTPQPWFRRRAAAPAVDDAALACKVDDAVALLRSIAARHAPAVLASSFGAEDMVVIDLIAKHALPIRVFTLDTGRLPDETHALIDRTRERYGLPVDIYTPDARLLQGFVRENGVNAFYKSVELRKACCSVRKSEPLKRALVAKGAWITGLRREQSVTRGDRRRGVRRGARDPEVQSARRLEPRRRVALRARARRPVQHTARSRLSVDRLRALHARDRARRGRARGALVVGSARAQGVRAAPAADSDRREGSGAAAGHTSMSTVIERLPNTAPPCLAHSPRTAGDAFGGQSPADADHVDWLESEAIHILREVAAQCRNPALLAVVGRRGRAGRRRAVLSLPGSARRAGRRQRHRARSAPDAGRRTRPRASRHRRLDAARLAAPRLAARHLARQLAVRARPGIAAARRPRAAARADRRTPRPLRQRRAAL
jgi:uncharacterized protein (DUF934 family)/3'-phosphoadenosine 5'-phosphosulfate sulfotransferase (PAPS reductase)/FAD synthetase